MCEGRLQSLRVGEARHVHFLFHHKLPNLLTGKTADFEGSLKCTEIKDIVKMAGKNVMMNPLMGKHTDFSKEF